MVVAELDVVRVPIRESKADAPLIVHRDRILASSIPGQRMEPITGWNTQVVNARSKIDILELSSRSLRNVWWDPPRFAKGVQLLGTTISERLYHLTNVTRHVTRGKYLLAARQQPDRNNLVATRQVTQWLLRRHARDPQQSGFTLQGGQA